MVSWDLGLVPMTHQSSEWAALGLPCTLGFAPQMITPILAILLHPCPWSNFLEGVPPLAQCWALPGTASIHSFRGKKCKVDFSSCCCQISKWPVGMGSECLPYPWIVCLDYTQQFVDYANQGLQTSFNLCVWLSKDCWFGWYAYLSTMQSLVYQSMLWPDA